MFQLSYNLLLNYRVVTFLNPCFNSSDSHKANANYRKLQPLLNGKHGMGKCLGKLIFHQYFKWEKWKIIVWVPHSDRKLRTIERWWRPLVTQTMQMKSNVVDGNEIHIALINGASCFWTRCCLLHIRLVVLSSRFQCPLTLRKLRFSTTTTYVTWNSLYFPAHWNYLPFPSLVHIGSHIHFRYFEDYERYRV